MRADPSTVRNRAQRAWAAANRAAVEAHVEAGGREQDAPQLVPIGLHEARHACASVLIASGAHSKVVQKVMGHSTIAETFDTYGHLMPDGLGEAAKAANAYLTRAMVQA